MANERKKEIYRLLKEEYKEQVEELERREQGVNEQREIVNSTQVQLNFYEKYLDNSREIDASQIPLDIKVGVAVQKPKVSGDRKLVRNINTIKVPGNQVIHLLRHTLKRASPRLIIEVAYKDALKLSEIRPLKYAIRNKVKHGKLFLARFNNSLKYSFAILPEWIDDNKKFKKEYWPLPEYLPNRVSKIRIIRMKKGLL